jgi:sugar phosphate isomerase/epimerase
MKYSFMSFSTPEFSLEECLDAVKEYGYDGFEPRAQANHAHGVETDASPEKRKDIKTLSAEKGVPIGCIATSLRFADVPNRAQTVSDAFAFIDLCGDLGVPALRIFGGPIPEGMSREAAVDAVCDVYREVLANAEQKNVALCMETHDDWCDPKDVAEVLKRLDHPMAAANWDIMHPVRTGKAGMEESFHILKPWIRHVHVHDAGELGDKINLVPIGKGKYDHKTAVQLLRDNGYEGYISGEWINWEAANLHLPRELAALKRYETE